MESQPISCCRAGKQSNLGQPAKCYEDIVEFSHGGCNGVDISEYNKLNIPQ